MHIVIMANQTNKYKITDYLTKCDVCGEYKGTFTEDNADGSLEVLCLCDGTVCETCGVKIHRPISNYYNGKLDQIIHVPFFMTKCKDCAHKSNDQQN